MLYVARKCISERQPSLYGRTPINHDANPWMLLEYLVICRRHHANRFVWAAFAF